MKKIERKNKKLTKKIEKLNSKYDNIKLTALNKYTKSNKVDKIHKSLQVSKVIIMIVSSIFRICTQSTIAGYILVLTASALPVSTIIELICITVEWYEQKLYNKLERLDRKICKLEHKKNIIDNEITKSNKIEKSENKELQDNSSTKKIIVSNSNANTNYNRRFTIYEDDIDEIDDMSHVVNSLKKEEIVFEGVEIPHKVRTRTMK